MSRFFNISSIPFIGACFDGVWKLLPKMGYYFPTIETILLPKVEFYFPTIETILMLLTPEPCELQLRTRDFAQGAPDPG
jgi:hypothetical protein